MDLTSTSLLFRAQSGEEAAWDRLVALYRPWICRWLCSRGIQTEDADDLAQDVLAVVLRKLKDFDHTGQAGSFRAWLRTITANHLREFWRAGKIRVGPSGGEDFDRMAENLADPESSLTKEWNAQHDAHLLSRLLQIVERDFEPVTVQVFRRLAFEGAAPADVAAETGLSVAAVYTAKSRVLQRLRQEAGPLID